MTASELAKSYGLKSLKTVGELTNQSVQVLNLWHKNKPELFKVVLCGCVSQSSQSKLAKIEEILKNGVA